MRAVFPGSFDPLTIAHVAIADAVRGAHEVTRLDLAISRRPLGKPAGEQAPVGHRVETIAKRTHDRPWLQPVVTEHRLLVDIAEGYDLLVVGADKWHQLHDPGFYDDDPAARDAAIERLPPLAVIPRGGIVLPSSVRATLLVIPDEHRDVSSSGARAGRHDWRA